MNYKKVYNQLVEIFEGKQICLLNNKQVMDILRTKKIRFTIYEVEKLKKIFCSDEISTMEIKFKEFYQEMEIER